MAVDCHMHMILDGVFWKTAIDRHREKPDIGWICGVLQTYQAQGFTYLRDGGDRWGAGKAAREIAPEYGICYRTPLAPLCKKGHYGGFIGVCYENLKEYAGLVKQARKNGADFIKIMISGLMDFHRFGVLTEEPLTKEEIFQLVHIAKEEGFSVMAHANGGDCVLAAAEAGVDSVEHGAYLHEEALAAMAQQKTVWVPTLSTVGNLRGKERFPQAEVEKILAGVMEAVAAFGAMGGLVACGSDAGAWEVPHGCKTEQELLTACLGAEAEEIFSRGNRAIQEKF